MTQLRDTVKQLMALSKQRGSSPRGNPEDQAMRLLSRRSGGGSGRSPGAPSQSPPGNYAQAAAQPPSPKRSPAKRSPKQKKRGGGGGGGDDGGAAQLRQALRAAVMGRDVGALREAIARADKLGLSHEAGMGRKALARFGAS